MNEKQTSDFEEQAHSEHQYSCYDDSKMDGDQNVQVKPGTQRNDRTKSKDCTRCLMSLFTSCNKLKVTALLIVLSIIIIITIAIVDIKLLYKVDDSRAPIQRRYWTFARRGDTPRDGRLINVYSILDSLGYMQECPDDVDSLAFPTTLPVQWDLLWVWGSLAPYYDHFRNLEPHQKINQIPGNEDFISKVRLSTTPLKYMLPSFKLPDEKDKFLNFTFENPTKQFVVKSRSHRLIEFKTLAEIQAEGYLDSNRTFIQEYLANPLLVSGHKFDIGIYTVITSVDPLRIYIYNGEAGLRFCPQIFHPFDPKILDKYVVADEYLPIWKVPKIRYWYNNLRYSMRDSLNAYLTEEGRDGARIWQQIEESIVISIQSKRDYMKDALKGFKSKRNFFELYRLDFLVDENLNVHLLEANMSPFLASPRFQANNLIYQQVTYNVLGLVGLADRLQTHVLQRSHDEFEMETSYKNIMVSPTRCYSASCRRNCSELHCRLCLPCLKQNKELEQDLRDAHKEHLNRGDCKRLYPPPMERFQPLPETVHRLPTNDQLMYLWFQEKCNLDRTWC